jgi:hypothetical protein
VERHTYGRVEVMSAMFILRVTVLEEGTGKEMNLIIADHKKTQVVVRLPKCMSTEELC